MKIIRIKLFLICPLILLFTYSPSYANSFSPKITICGEGHRSQTNKLIRNILIKLADEGEFYIALEGSPYGPLNTSQTIYGIENTIQHVTVMTVKSYVMLYRSLNALHGEEDYLTENVSEFIQGFFDQDPFVVEIWQKIPRPFKNFQDEKLASFIDKLLIVDDPNNLFEPTSQGALDFLEIFNRGAISFMNVARVFAMQLGKYVENLEELDSSILYDMLQSPHDIEKELVFAAEVAVKWRDKGLSKNILKIYDFAKKDKKNLVVIIGLLHLENLKKLLESSDDKIEVQMKCAL